MNYRVITISRQYGSGGREIGRLVAEKLGIDYLDGELVKRTAEAAGMTEEMVKEFEESYSLLPYYDLTAPHEALSVEDRTFLAQSKVIREAAEKGHCLIVGRAAEYVLSQRDDVLSIFIHADKDSRIKRVSQRSGITELEADRKVGKTDRQRGHYYHHYTGNEWGAPSNYHLMLNSGLLGIEATVNAIVRIVQKAG